MSTPVPSMPEFLTLIEKPGIRFEQAAAARQAASSDHNSRETPLFAKSIERKALATRCDFHLKCGGEDAVNLGW
jgi:hypothetical protein